MSFHFLNDTSAQQTWWSEPVTKCKVIELDKGKDVITDCCLLSHHPILLYFYHMVVLRNYSWKIRGIIWDARFWIHVAMYKASTPLMWASLVSGMAPANLGYETPPKIMLKMHSLWVLFSFIWGTPPQQGLGMPGAFLPAALKGWGMQNSVLMFNTWV